MNKECVIVLGVYGKLGTVVAEELLNTGYTVLGVGRDKQRLLSLPFVKHPAFCYIAVDITDEKIDDILLPKIEQFTSVTIIICSGNHTSIESQVEATNVTQTNISGLLNIYHRIFLPLQDRQPFLLVISSVMAFIPDRRYPSYAAAKAAINQFVRSVVSNGKIRGKILALSLGPIDNVPGQSPFRTNFRSVAWKILQLIRQPESGIEYYPASYRILQILFSWSPIAFEKLIYNFRKPVNDKAG
jgi:short-subunit dehydrogenase